MNIHIWPENMRVFMDEILGRIYLFHKSYIFFTISVEEI
jgi:hypothetical protein